MFVATLLVAVGWNYAFVYVWFMRLCWWFMCLCVHYSYVFVYVYVCLCVCLWIMCNIMCDLGQKMTTSDFWHCILAFWKLSEVTDLGWPHTYPQCLNGLFFGGGGDHEVLRRNKRPILHADLLIVPLDTFWRELGFLTHFALRRFSRWGWRCSLPESASQIFD